MYGVGADIVFVSLGSGHVFKNRNANFIKSMTQQDWEAYKNSDSTSEQSNDLFDLQMDNHEGRVKFYRFEPTLTEKVNMFEDLGKKTVDHLNYRVNSVLEEQSTEIRELTALINAGQRVAS